MNQCHTWQHHIVDLNTEINFSNAVQWLLKLHWCGNFNLAKIVNQNLWINFMFKMRYQSSAVVGHGHCWYYIQEVTHFVMITITKLMEWRKWDWWLQLQCYFFPFYDDVANVVSNTKLVGVIYFLLQFIHGSTISTSGGHFTYMDSLISQHG